MSRGAMRVSWLGGPSGAEQYPWIQRAGGLANGWTTRKRTASGEAPARPRAGRGLVGGPT